MEFLCGLGLVKQRSTILDTKIPEILKVQCIFSDFDFLVDITANLI